ncbi:hypothetical protein BS50DRAFT_380456 [Corynespora cassiicola Philippines]|uniref:C2H2-type domain-containing protein n=1 Tax=Corynespora cassiicola Philippines TaxID=1448308 RepID=A0A2T2NNP9_CORCC|nr:hypothetical protein BS50DRAFT_380456 [Corynespora cassiicola Philippines]
MTESRTLESCPDSGRASPIHLSENESDGGDNRGTAQDRPLNRPAVDEDDIGESGDNEEMVGPSRKRRRSKKVPDKKFECPHEGCRRTYSRASHLYRHRLNHDSKRIHHCDFPDCHRTFFRQDLFARHKQRHTAGGSQPPLKDTSLSNLNPGVPTATSGSASKSHAELGRPNLPPVSSIVNSIPVIPPISLPVFYPPPAPSSESEDHSSSDGESTYSLREQRLSSADGSTITPSSPGGLLGDALAFADTELNARYRLLMPSRHIYNIKRLRQMVFENSAIKHQFIENTILSNIPHDYNLFSQLYLLIFETCESLRGLQEAGFCGHFFSVLVLDKSRSNVAKLLPIEIARVEYLRGIFRGTFLDLQNRMFKEHDASKSEDGPGVDFKIKIPRELYSVCRHFLEQLQIMPKISETSDLIYLLAITVHFLDLAVLSYVGTHTGAMDEVYPSQGGDTIHLPGRFGALKKYEWDDLHRYDRVVLQKRQLKCLDQFLGHRTVWVFHTHTNSSSNERLYLSTDVATLTDVWGPLWKSKSDMNSSKVWRYDIGNGFIVPWDRDQEIDPHPSTNGEGGTEVFCHWMPTREWDDDYVEQHQKEVFSKDFFESDRLLIGAITKDRLAVNDQCTMSMARKLQIKKAMKNAGNLRHRGTCRPRRERGSQSFQVQASAAGFATLGTTLEYKRVEGFNIKDALLQRWRNGSRNIKYLEIWGGVEISLCTENARRVQLLHLLRSPGLKNYLRAISFQWSSPDCESAYFEALKDRRSFWRFWREHPEWQRNIGDAINECFIALEETGVDERDDALSALWVEVFDDEKEFETENSVSEFPVTEEHLVVLRRHEHTWTGLLKDSPECITMAVVESTCLEFDDSYSLGTRCQSLHFSQDGRRTIRYSPGFSVLQTAILLNEFLLADSDQLCYRTYSRKRKLVECEEEKVHAEMKNGTRRKPHSEDYAQYNLEYFGHSAQSWNGYWDVTNLSRGTKFSLGSHGQLRILRTPSVGIRYPVVVEWEPVINTKAKEVKRELRERALGKSEEEHHSEYMEGAYLRSPLPCLLLSKKSGEK